MADVQRSLPVILEILENLGHLSGYKVNLSKSALMLVNVDQKDVSTPPTPKIIVKKEVLYLGIKISTSLTNIAKTNLANGGWEKKKGYEGLSRCFSFCILSVFL